MDKPTLRKTYLEKRNTLSDTEYIKRNKALCSKLFNSIDFSNVKYLHLFLPILKFNEVNTWLIIKHIKEHYPTINIVIPKVENSILNHYLFESKEQLTKSKWGIDEPSYGKIIEPKKIDLVLVPLIIADKQGNRIGYGKGFYDRFLKDCKPNCKKVGLSLLPLLDEILCIEPTDIPLDHVITA